MQTSDTSVTLAGTVLGRHRHICAFFHSADDEYRIILPFIKEGLDLGQKGFHIIDPELGEAHRRRIASSHIDVEVMERSGQLEIRTWEQAYLRNGEFDQDAMLALIEEVLEAGPKHGYALTRLVARMEWALEDKPGVSDLVEYETRLNYLLPRYKDPVV